MSKIETTTLGRLEMALVGGMAGASVWALVDVLPDMMTDQPRLYLFLAAFAASFFTAWLAMSGPLSILRACGLSAGLALPVAGLLTWGSTRFDTIEGFFETGHPAVSFALLGLIPLPFLIARVREGKWASYPHLFAFSWNIVVRYAAAWLFVGVAWGVLMLSDALLNLVGIDIIEWLFEQEAVPYLFTGAALGMALAVVNELSDYVSPYLVLRLLRLLLPVVLVVVAVFLGALPFRGLSHLFGDFSVAGTLLAMAMGGITLVTTALDADAERAVKTVLMRAASQWLALLIPALAVLASYAIWLRVDQYGVTPDRLAAATLAALVLGYGVFYAVAVLLRGDWQRRIRQVNIVMALATVSVATLWLTPAFNPQRIATANQIARFLDGKVDAQKIDLWAIGREWGRPGRDGLAALQALDHPQAARLAERMADLEDSRNRYAFEQRSEVADQTGVIAALAEVLVVRPEGQDVPVGVLNSLRQWEREELLKSCKRRTAQGNPGCVLLRAELSGDIPGDEAVLIYGTGRGAPTVRAYYADGDSWAQRFPEFLSGGGVHRSGDRLIDSILAGDFTLRPVPLNALDVDGHALFFGR